MQQVTQRMLPPMVVPHRFYGPRSRNFVSTTEASTSSTEIPAKSRSHGVAMWNVNNDGTGGSKVWPSETASCPSAGVLP